jgi:hypothetical protein
MRLGAIGLRAAVPNALAGASIFAEAATAAEAARKVRREKFAMSSAIVADRGEDALLAKPH